MHRYGDLYGYGGRIDAIYEREIAPRLPSPETHYLDWTAAALYLNSQVQDSMKDLKSNLYGNPHSAHASSALTTAKIEQLREDLLAYFGADPEEYTLCFVRSATGALDYIGQMFPWSKNSRYVHSRSNHNSVLGIREYARKAGGLTSAIDEGEIDQWLQEDSEEESDEGEGEGEGGGSASSPSYSLFAYPLYENFAGSIYPRSWADSIRRKPTRKGRRWLVSVSLNHNLDPPSYSKPLSF